MNEEEKERLVRETKELMKTYLAGLPETLNLRAAFEEKDPFSCGKILWVDEIAPIADISSESGTEGISEGMTEGRTEHTSESMPEDVPEDTAFG